MEILCSHSLLYYYCIMHSYYLTDVEINIKSHLMWTFRMNIYRMRTECCYIILKYIVSINELYYPINILIDVFIREYLKFFVLYFLSLFPVSRQNGEGTELIRTQS